MDVLVSASPGGNSTSRGDISGQLNFSTRSLFTKMVVSPRVHLFVNLKEFKISRRQAQKQVRPIKLHICMRIAHRLIRALSLSTEAGVNIVCRPQEENM